MQWRTEDYYYSLVSLHSLIYMTGRMIVIERTKCDQSSKLQDLSDSTLLLGEAMRTIVDLLTYSATTFAA